jgi:hypothetical protein
MRMTDRIWNYALIVMIFGSILITSCQKEEFSNAKQDVTGIVQKGPYIIGTSISMSELKSSLEQTGKTFTTQISDNSGSFELKDVSLTSKFVQLSASGFYFDEVKGTISLAPLNLLSLSDLTNTETVNVNILTHLEKLRVDYLVKQNETFSEAKKIAQTEVLGIFGYKSSKIDNSELLDISVDKEGNAILLAISIIVQGNRSVGDLSELLANISNDLYEDGILNSESLLSKMRSSAKELDLSTIRSNLENRYNDLGIDATIPNYEKYVNDFLAFTGEKPVVSTISASDVEPTSVMLSAIVNPNSLSTSISFEYGTTTSYGNTISAIQNTISGASNLNVSARLTDLLPGLSYHCRVRAENTKGITIGEDLIFTTLGQAPTATTMPASNILSNGVTLNGVVNANYLPTTVIFEYGATTSYGETETIIQSPLNGYSNTSVNLEITGLIIGTTYHFRIKASNELGSVVGEDFLFTSGYTIGGNELGGIIAYILQPGDPGYTPGETHGLVTADINQSEGVQWYNGSYLITGATGISMGYGDANTTAIINAQGNTGIYAAKLCRDYRGGGFTDWYLPSKDELNKLYLNRAQIGGLSTDPYGLFYWSSTEYDDHGACYHQFGKNEVFCGFWKINVGKVRAVRSF